MNNRLGEFIKEYRQEHDLSLRQFGSLCGVSHTHIDSIERGTDPRTGKAVKLTNDMISKIAIATNKTPGYIFALSVNDKVAEEESPYIIDEDLRILQRAREQMSQEEKEQMLDIVKAAFKKYFQEG